MKKFTIFSVLLAMIVLIVALEVGANGYGIGSDDLPAFADNDGELNLPTDLDLSQVMQTDVLGSDISDDEGDLDFGGDRFLREFSGLDTETFDVNEEPVEREQPVNNDPLVTRGSTAEEEPATVEKPVVVVNDDPVELASDVEVDLIPAFVGEESDSGLPDFENDNYVPVIDTVYLRDDMVRSAGFATAYIEQEPHNDFLYKTIYLGDIADLTSLKYAIRTDEQLLAKVYVLRPGPLKGVDDVYALIKIRASEANSSVVNETNEYGDGSFYMNDSRRDNVAFLTVRFGQLIYAFSYPKNYHLQIVNLIKLVDMEF